MILQNATIQYKGYDPNDLSKGSNKCVCCSCDRCGRVRYTGFKDYSNLCKLCSCSGKNNSMYGRSGDKNPMYGVHRYNEDNPNWKGGLVTLTCKICGKEFKVKRNRKDTAKFCCYKCEGEWLSINKVGKDNPNWKGGIAYDRSHVLPINQCIQLNKRFNDSEFHHITKSVGIFIPKELHQHIRHNLRTGKNMGLINLLSLQFINGSL